MDGGPVLSREICVQNLRAYKVFGDDMTLQSMRDHAWAFDDLDGRDGQQHPEWQALYMQFKQSHVLGTVPYRWDKMAYTHAQLVEVLFDSLEVVVFDGPLLHDGSVGAEEKAAAVKTHLQLASSAAEDEKTGLLMHELGKSGKAALVRETEEEWELLIPHCLVPRLRFSEKPLARWRRHKSWPESSHWCDLTQMKQAGSEIWDVWDDNLQVPSIPDLDIPGLETSTPESENAAQPIEDPAHTE